MNWEALGAIGEIVGATAGVLVPHLSRSSDTGGGSRESGGDRARGQCFLVEGLSKQQERGVLSGGSWAAHDRTIAGLMENDFVWEWWKSGVSPHAEAFIRHVDGLVERPVPGRWSYSPPAELGSDADAATADHTESEAR